MSTTKKLGLLASLYLSQGLPFGFFTLALPVLLHRMGLSLPAIGLSNLLALPWALKFLWAPFLDRRNAGRLGRRRGVILPIQLLSAISLFALAIPSSGPSVPLLLASVLLVNLLAATQDVATDGLAIEILSPSELGLGNGLQVAAYRVGMILGGGFLLYIFDSLGFRGTVLCLGILLLLATIPISLFHEPASTPPKRESPSFSYWLRRPGALPWLGLLFLYKSGDAFATGMLKVFLVDEKGAGLGPKDISILFGWVGFGAGLLGALIGGALVRRLGYRRSLLAFGSLQALSVLPYVYIATHATPFLGIAAACAGEHLASGMATAALFTAMMDVCRPSHAGTDYTVQASLVVIASGGAATLSGFSAHALGYAGHFTAGAVLAGLAILFIVFFFPKERDIVGQSRGQTQDAAPPALD